jgi:penicillin-binding protein 1A
MVENGAITRAEADQAMAEPLVTRARGETEVVRADYFAEEARRWLAARFGEEQLYRGGLAVHTTLDPKLQAIAERAFRNGVVAYDRRHGWRGPVASIAFDVANWQGALAMQQKPPSAAPEWQLALVLKVSGKQAEIGVADGNAGTIPLEDLGWARFVNPELKMGPPVKKVTDVLNPGDVILVEPKADKPDLYTLRQVPEVSGGMVVMDPHNGRVLAMVGGLSYEKSEFNRATQANRQPGSAFKPFIYLAALDNGYTPSTIVMDEPIELPQGPGLPLWKPENYSEDFHGPSTVRYGIEHSRNLMTVRIANDLGMDIIADYTKRFGINDNLPKYLSSSLGSIETTVLRLTAAYAMLVNGGKKIEPAFIERIQDKTGVTIYRRDTRVCDGCRVEQFDSRPPPILPDDREVVADPITTYQIVSMLEGVVKRGTATTVSTLGIPLAGKTGTTNEFRDAWFVGFSPDLVVGTYIGFDQPRSLGKKETGGRVVAPVFREFMAEATKDHPAVPFRVPNGVKFFRVNLETGAPAAPGDKKVILEAFRPGTSPATARIFDDNAVVSGGQGTGGGGGTPDGQDDDVGGLY